jgi:hypothetical protein
LGELRKALLAKGDKIFYPPPAQNIFEKDIMARLVTKRMVKLQTKKPSYCVAWGDFCRQGII